MLRLWRCNFPPIEIFFEGDPSCGTDIAHMQNETLADHQLALALAGTNFRLRTRNPLSLHHI